MKNSIIKTKSILICLVIISCASKSNIYIKVSTTNEINKKMITSDSEYLLKSDYFEIELKSYKNGDFFKAETDLIKPKAFEDFKLSTLYIVDKNGEPLEFKSSTDFLNFMSKNGYEMKDQKENKYSTKYTFKRE